MTREEEEGSILVTILNPLNKEVIKKIKDKDRDIIIDLNNNIILIRTIKVVVLPKFLRQREKLEEYFNKVTIYIYYNKDSFLSKRDKTLFIILYLEGVVF
jgi:hypothetical protein